MSYAQHSSIINVFEEGEVEVECDHVSANFITEKPLEKKESYQQECITAFYVLEDGMIFAANIFNLKHSTGEIEWYVQSDGEFLEWEESKTNISAWK